MYRLINSVIKQVLVSNILIGLSFISTAQTGLDQLSQLEKSAFVQAYIQQHQLSGQGLPEIVISEESSANYGLHEKHKSGTGNRITLYPRAFSNLGQFEVTIRHELYHYWFDKNGGPENFKDLVSRLEGEVLENFDFSSIPSDYKSELVSDIASNGKEKLEEMFISELILGEAHKYDDPDNALIGATATYESDKQDYLDFWETDVPVTIGGAPTSISPKSKNTSVTWSSAVSGKYDCAGCADVKTGKAGTWYTDPNRNQAVTNYPTEVRFNGNSDIELVFVNETNTKKIRTDLGGYVYITSGNISRYTTTCQVSTMPSTNKGSGLCKSTHYFSGITTSVDGRVVQRYPSSNKEVDTYNIELELLPDGNLKILNLKQNVEGILEKTGQ